MRFVPTGRNLTVGVSPYCGEGAFLDTFGATGWRRAVTGASCERLVISFYIHHLRNYEHRMGQRRWKRRSPEP